MYYYCIIFNAANKNIFLLIIFETHFFFAQKKARGNSNYFGSVLIKLIIQILLY